MDGYLSGAGAGAEEGISSFAEKNPAKQLVLGSKTPGSRLEASFRAGPLGVCFLLTPVPVIPGLPKCLLL